MGVIHGIWLPLLGSLLVLHVSANTKPSGGCNYIIDNNAAYLRCMQNFKAMFTGLKQGASEGKLDKNSSDAVFCSDEGRAAVGCVLEFFEKCPQVFSGDDDSGTYVYDNLETIQFTGVDIYCDALDGAKAKKSQGPSCFGCYLRNMLTPIKIISDGDTEATQGTMSLVPRLARREIGVANTVAVSALKEKLFRRYLDELLFDSSLLQILYVRCFNLAVRYPILAAYLIRNFITSQQSDEENCLVLFVKKWAKQFPEYGFLFEEVLDIVDQIRDEDFLMD